MASSPIPTGKGHGTDPGNMTGMELLGLYRRHELSPVEATQASLERIERFNPIVNAYCFVDHDAAIASARESERRWMRNVPIGPLDGIPSSVKDLILAKGMPTRRGSLATSPNGPWDQDAPATALMRGAGAVLLGKTTTPEFGWKGLADSPLTGITRNPWNTGLTPGGSSGGAAVAAALNMGVLHVGTDAGGSIRIPCAFTGVFGHKPTFGLVPQWPASAMGRLSHLGPISRSVADSALLLTTIGRPGTRDSYAGPATVEDWTVGLKRGVRNLRIAYSPTLGYANVEPEVAAIMDNAVERLRDLGAIVETVDPGFADPTESLNTLWYAGAANSVSKLGEDALDKLDPGLVAMAKLGREIDILRYMQALDETVALSEHMAQFHAQWDLLVTPTMPITAFPVGRNTPDSESSVDWLSWTPFCHPFNLTMQPAASVPCGMTRANLPVGLQIIGARYRDDLVLSAAYAFEQAFPVTYPAEPYPALG